jgi:hypothetical protein
VPLETIFKCLCRSYGVANAEIDELKYLNGKLREKLHNTEQKVCSLKMQLEKEKEYFKTAEQLMPEEREAVKYSDLYRSIIVRNAKLESDNLALQHELQSLKRKYELDMAELIYNYSKK